MRISDWSSDVCSSDLRDVDHPVDIVARAAVCGIRKAGVDRSGKGAGIGLLEDYANGAAHRSGTEQRALRPSQHLDAVEVERLKVHGGTDRLGDGRLVDIDAGRRIDRRSVG